MFWMVVMLVLWYVICYNSINCNLISSLQDDPWKRGSVPTTFWQHEENQKRYLNWLAEELNINQTANLEGWYSITWLQIAKKGGRGLLRCYGDSPCKLFQALYPEFPWQGWKF